MCVLVLSCMMSKQILYFCLNSLTMSYKLATHVCVMWLCFLIDCNLFHTQDVNNTVSDELQDMASPQPTSYNRVQKNAIRLKLSR